MDRHTDFCALNEATASLRRFLFTVYDDATGLYPQTGLIFSVPGSDIVVSKNGSADANSLGTVGEIGSGDYYYEAAQAELNVQGVTRILMKKPGTTTPYRPYRIFVRVGGKTDAAASVFSNVMENSKTFAEIVRLMARALVAKTSGGGTTTVKFRDLADTKDSIIATVDGNSNRTAITTLDGT